jgi:hypothetical protein
MTLGRAWRVVAGLAVGATTACGQQSFADGMRILCTAHLEVETENLAPAMRQKAIADFIDARLKNDEARAVFVRAGEVEPAERAEVLAAAVQKAGLTECALLAGTGDGQTPADAALLGGAKVPRVASARVVPPDPRAATVVIDGQAVRVGGQPVVAVRDGRVEAGEVEGGRTLAKLRAILRLSREGMPPTALALAAAGDTPSELVIMASASASAAGYRPLWLLVQEESGSVGALPVSLPETFGQDGTADAPPVAAGLGMVVTIDRQGWTLFSLSGQEGTLQAPLAKEPACGDWAYQWEPLEAALDGVVARHYAGQPRSAEDRRIVLMPEASTPYRVLVEAMVAAMAAPGKAERFPDVALGLGFR